MSHIHGESIDEIMLEAELRMEKAVTDLGREMASVRTGRASVNLLDPIKVDYYGTLTPLNQMATLTTPDPGTVTIQPWDAGQIRAIEKAIQASDLGINPTNNGKLIRLSIPPLTEERRRQLVKKLHDIIEQHRVAVRSVRREANEAVKALEKNKTVSEDESKKSHQDVQKLTDSMIQSVNEAGAKKEKEILEIG